MHLFHLIYLLAVVCSFGTDGLARSLVHSKESQRSSLATDIDNKMPPFMKHYAEFQISEGRGGTAKEEAEIVFVQPFEAVDLASIPFEVYDVLRLAKEAAEDAEIELFEPAIAKAGETPIGTALKVGKAKNRVLFATAAVQALRINAAQNKAMGVEDPYEELEMEYSEGYLTWAIEADRRNTGMRSLGIT